MINMSLRYLKLYEAFSGGDGWSVIDHDELEKLWSTRVRANLYELTELVKMFKRNGWVLCSYPNHGQFLYEDLLIYVDKLDDDWFLVKFSGYEPSNDEWIVFGWIKCDEWQGLINMLNEVVFSNENPTSAELMQRFNQWYTF